MTDLAKTTLMNDTPDTLPDRLCIDPASPYYDAAVLARDVGIRFKGGGLGGI